MIPWAVPNLVARLNEYGQRNMLLIERRVGHPGFVDEDITQICDRKICSCSHAWQMTVVEHDDASFLKQAVRVIELEHVLVETVPVVQEEEVDAQLRAWVQPHVGLLKVLAFVCGTYM